MDSGFEMLKALMLEVVVDGKEITAPGILTAYIPFSRVGLDGLLLDHKCSHPVHGIVLEATMMWDPSCRVPCPKKVNLAIMVDW